MQAPRTQNARRHGFTLVELVVVLLVLGILAGIAAPRLLAASRDAEAVVLLGNVRLIFDAAERYYARTGLIAEDSYPGEAPSDLVPDYLSAEPFAATTSVGGPLDWNGPGTTAPVFGIDIRCRSGVIAENTDLYQSLERLGDDGSAASGWISAKNRRIYFEWRKR